MTIFLIWGKDLEMYFGTITYAFLNFWIGILSTLMNLGFAYFKYSYVPEFIDKKDLAPHKDQNQTDNALMNNITAAIGATNDGPSPLLQFVSTFNGGK